MTYKRVAALVAVAALGFVVPPAGATPPGVGSPGVGDPFFPKAGNGGYDVRDYDLELSWDPATATLQATAHIEAVATQDLTQLDLDLRGFAVGTVRINGAPATTSRHGQELVLRPAHTLHAGARLAIDVPYSGTPELVTDPDGSPDGWMPTSDGIVVLSEPQGSPTWFPANDHPSDKATFSVEISVPSGLVAVSNGLPDPARRQGDRTTYRWHEDAPMAPYLATLAIGHFTISRTVTAAGVPVINAVTAGMEAASASSVDRIPEMVDWLTGTFGPFPFRSTGAIVVDAPDVGYDLETQDRPTFTGVPNDPAMIHELAHQWVGDSVSLATWPEMWLNEGFAGYVEWLWSEHDGGPTTDELYQQYRDELASRDRFWSQPIGPRTLPSASVLFSGPVYIRGAMTLHALRTTVGDDSFFRILRTWTTQNRYGNVTTDQFIDLAEQVSGRSLDRFFTAWLDTPAEPPLGGP